MSETGTFTHRETIVILVGLMLGMFLAALDQTIVATALPRISADLHGVAHLSWIVSAYLLTATAATPIYGKLSDLYGRKIMLQVSILTFLLTSILCAVATTMGQLILFRGLQGLGGAGLVSMAHATIADVISPRQRGRYQGYIAGVWGVASIIGPVLGGLFVDYLTWRWVFWINIPLGLAALAVSQHTLKRLKVKHLRHQIDYAGALLIVSAVCCLLLVTTMGGEEVPWSSPVIIGLSAAAIVLFGLCVAQERTAREPILPPRLFHNSVFVSANTASMLQSLAMFGTIVFMPLFLQLVFGFEPGLSGLMLIPLTLANVIASIVCGRMIARIGRYRVFPLVGLSCCTVGCLLLSTATGDTPMALIVIYTTLTGWGTGLVSPAIMVAVINAIDAHDLGAGTASINFFRSMGGSFGVALFSAVLIGRLGALVSGLPGHEALGPSPGLSLIHAGADALRVAPPAIHDAVAQAVVVAFRDMFRVGAGIFSTAFICMLFLKEIALKTTTGREQVAATGLAALSE